MAVMLSTIESYLLAEGLKYSIHDDHIRTSFLTDIYCDRDGEQSVFLVIKLEEDGEYFKIIAPNLYQYPVSGPNAKDVFQALLGICWRSKLIKYEYDEFDGEIRAIIEFPLEDSSITPKQFMRCLNGIVQLIDEYHVAISYAIADSTVSLDSAEEIAQNIRLANNIYREAGIKKLVASESPLKLKLEE